MRGNHPHGKPNTHLKGIRGGNCNVTACQVSIGGYQQHYNEVMHKWYCPPCAEDIQHFANMDGLVLFKGLANVNK